MSGRIFPRWAFPTIACLDSLRKRPAVFGHLSGLTIAAFDELAAEVVPVLEAAHRKRLDRPGRRRAVGGGDDFDLRFCKLEVLVDSVLGLTLSV